VTSEFGNYQKCRRGAFCYGWRQEQGKPKMQCPTYSDCVRNGLRTVSQDSTAFLVQMTNGAFGACEDFATRFDGPLPRMALMLRDPVSLVISSYIYHAQKPTPENWVINEFTAPCVPNAEQTCVSLSLSLNGMHALALILLLTLTLTPHLPAPFDAHGGEAVTERFNIQHFVAVYECPTSRSSDEHGATPRRRPSGPGRTCKQFLRVCGLTTAHVSSFCVYAA
jgi:hypothetical protein